ncbi:hypothetical protein [Amycolatopsis sp. NPDC051903]|uniref:hypothetical protein n=1 Tax=Amycolatopsis sp. NPDC051903 TaxID=3363936 RepID=UPI00379C039F
MTQQQVEVLRRPPAGAVLAIVFGLAAAVREVLFLALSPAGFDAEGWGGFDAWALLSTFRPTLDGTLSLSALGGLVSQVLCAVCCFAGAVFTVGRFRLGRRLIIAGAGLRLFVVLVTVVIGAIPLDGARVLTEPIALLLYGDWLFPLLALGLASGRRTKAWVS